MGLITREDDIMPESNIQPTNIQVESIASGVVTIRVHWDITQVERTGPNDDVITLWEYSECKLDWILPQVYETLSEVQAYLDANYSEGEKILDWAKASKVSNLT